MGVFIVHPVVYDERMSRPVSGESAVQALIDAMGSLDVVTPVEKGGPDQRADFEVRLANGESLSVDVKSLAHPTTTEIEGIVRRWRRGASGLRVLVADAIPKEARQVLTKAGISYLDRRGALVLVGPGVLVQADVEPALRPGPARAGDGVRGESGIAVALATLLRPDDPPGVREMHRLSGLSVGAISKARQRLRDSHLLDESYRPLRPELFWTLSGVWAPEMVDLPAWPGGADAPDPVVLDQRFGAQLRVPLLEGLDEAVTAYRPGRALEGSDPHAGWTLTGTLAAAAYGAEVVAGRGSVPELLVPAEHWHRVTAHTVAPTPAQRPVARLAMAPTSLAVRLRRPPAKVRPFPLAHPIVVALELARDRARGQEILTTFSPEGCDVVWR